LIFVTIKGNSEGEKIGVEAEAQKLASLRNEAIVCLMPHHKNGVSKCCYFNTYYAHRPFEFATIKNFTLSANPE